MTAIVLNTLTGAVSEYSGFDFHAITQTHAGSAIGLYLLGGNVDVAATILSQVTAGKTLLGADKKASVEIVFLSMKGSGESTLTLSGESVSYDYPFAVLADGVSRCRPGRGFRENYAAIGYSNTDGADFQIDQIEVLNVVSTTRRTQ